MKITTRCGQPAVDGLNEALLARAVEAKVLKTNRVRADTTVVEANVATRRTPAVGQGRGEDGQGGEEARRWAGEPHQVR